MSNMSKNELISIIILNYNGREYIFDCIESVFKTVGCNFEVILIDNYSSDFSSDDCKDKFPELILIKNKKNLAMAARNVGIDNANGDYIVFLDADTVVDGRDETEREIFRDYLLLNLKLYFDKFEEDLSPDLQEPETPAEDEYIKTAQSRGEGGDELIPPEEEAPAI